MTDKEKAKAFDKALERARKMLNMILDNELIGFPDQIREIFPQLRESEDERLIKAITHILYENYTDAAVVEGVEIAEIVTWLEKQKEQKSVQCIDFDNEFENQVSHLLASILNGEWEYNEGFIKHAAQSLMGYAKNEMKQTKPVEQDEWDKREKLFTKALQTANARIGQLFEENRKLKEQKPLTTEETELNSIAFLEQMGYTCIPPGKEQKPVESRKRDKPKESWLSRAKYEIEHADELLTQRQEELREIREMKKQEQKDALLELQQKTKEFLEKQERHKLAEPKYPQFVFDDKLALESAMYIVDKKGNDPVLYEALKSLHSRIIDVLDYSQKEQEPSANKKSEKPINPSSKFHPGDWVVYDGPLGHAILQVKDIVDGRYTFVDNDSTLLEEDSDKFLRPLTPKDVKGKQKPSVEDVLTKAGLKPYKDGNKWCILAGDNLQEGLCGFGDTIEDALYEFLIDVLNTQKEQKPTEWSEEDSLHLTNAILSAEKEWGTESCTAKWLKSLPERFNLQPKEEWSEEDEKIAKEIEEELWYPGDFPDYPSKEENELYDDCQRRLNWFKNKLKTIRPSWKPSEEQMGALSEAVSTFDGYEESDAIKSLYNDLKKLM